MTKATKARPKKGMIKSQKNSRYEALGPKVFQLYLEGKTQSAIAARISEEGDPVTQQTICDWLNRGIRDAVENIPDMAADYVVAQLGRLDVIYEALADDMYVYRREQTGYDEDKKKAIYDQVKHVDTDVIDKMIKVIDKKCKLLGLDAVKKLEVTHVTIQDVILQSFQPPLIETVAKEGRVDEQIIDVEASEVSDND